MLAFQPSFRIHLLLSTVVLAQFRSSPALSQQCGPDFNVEVTGDGPNGVTGWGFLGQQCTYGAAPIDPTAFFPYSVIPVEENPNFEGWNRVETFPSRHSGPRACESLAQNGQLPPSSNTPAPTLQSTQAATALGTSRPTVAPDTSHQLFSSQTTAQVQASAQESKTTLFSAQAPTVIPPPTDIPMEQGYREATTPQYISPDIGGPPADGVAAATGDDPVNPVTGEFIVEETDIHIPGVGLDFRFKRTYRSRWSYNGPLGHAWSHSFDQRLKPATSACGENRLAWKTGHGSVVLFEQSATGTWTTEAPLNVRLVDKPTHREIITPSGTRSVFDSRGALTQIIDTNQNSLSLYWLTLSGSGTEAELQLQRIIDSVGRQFDFSYGPDGYLDSVASPALGGVLSTYTIDALGDLVAVTNFAGQKHVYDYDTEDPTSPNSTRAGQPFRLISDDLVSACRTHCGSTIDSCGGACAAVVEDAETHCISSCADNDRCMSACTEPIPQTCQELATTEGYQFCLDICNQGFFIEPTPEACLTVAPPTIALGNIRDLGSAYSFSACVAQELTPWYAPPCSNTDEPHDPETIPYSSPSPRRCCLRDELVAAQTDVYNRCLLDPPLRRRSGPILGGCREASIASCAGVSSLPEVGTACMSACVGKEGRCTNECREYNFCAHYSDRRFDAYGVLV